MTGARLDVCPLTLREARAFVDRHHRHHRAPQGGLFAIGAMQGDDIVGCVIVGKPVARLLATDPFAAEVTRLCCVSRNASSMLYAAAWRACRAMGYRKLVTYTLATESGASMRAVGWRMVAEVRGGTWSRQSRPRVDTHPLQEKLRWELSA